jgi:ubiquinone biosynthesis protein UbiJ
MPLFPPLSTVSQLVAYALNTLLKREDWARERLRVHAGKTVQFALDRIILTLTIDHQGYAEAAKGSVVPDVTLSILSEKLDLGLLLGDGTPRDFAKVTHISGDAALARVVADLASDLRWDVEDELAQVVGDIPAGRLVASVRAVGEGLFTAGRRLTQNFSEYLTEESGVLAGKPLLQQHHNDLTRLAERVDVLLRQSATLPTRLTRIAARRRA